MAKGEQIMDYLKSILRQWLGYKDLYHINGLELSVVNDNQEEFCDIVVNTNGCFTTGDIVQVGKSKLVIHGVSLKVKAL